MSFLSSVTGLFFPTYPLHLDDERKFQTEEDLVVRFTAHLQLVPDTEERRDCLDRVRQVIQENHIHTFEQLLHSSLIARKSEVFQIGVSKANVNVYTLKRKMEFIHPDSKLLYYVQPEQRDREAERRIDLEMFRENAKYMRDHCFDNAIWAVYPLAGVICFVSWTYWKIDDIRETIYETTCGQKIYDAAIAISEWSNKDYPTAKRFSLIAIPLITLGAAFFFARWSK